MAGTITPEGLSTAFESSSHAPHIELEGSRHIVRDDADAFNRAYGVYKDKSVRDCIPLVGAALDEKQKAATLANLLDLAMADGVLAGAEENLLETYVQSFGRPEDIVSRLVDVIAMKNDFSVFEQGRNQGLTALSGFSRMQARPLFAP